MGTAKLFSPPWPVLAHAPTVTTMAARTARTRRGVVRMLNLRRWCPLVQSNLRAAWVPRGDGASVGVYAPQFHPAAAAPPAPGALLYLGHTHTIAVPGGSM